VLSARGGESDGAGSAARTLLPPLKRWAHGRLPARARATLDTGDLVQEAVMHVLARLDKFEPRHVGAMQAYLRLSVINRIRDEIRARWPDVLSRELTAEPPSDATSPLEAVSQGTGLRAVSAGTREAADARTARMIVRAVRRSAVEHSRKSRSALACRPSTRHASRIEPLAQAAHRANYIQIRSTRSFTDCGRLLQEPRPLPG